MNLALRKISNHNHLFCPEIDFMRYPARILAVLFCLLALAPAVLAQAPPAYKGTTTTVSGSTSDQEWSYGAGAWNISGPSTYVSDTSPNGWAVNSYTNTAAITVPATAATGQYTVQQGIKFKRHVPNGEQDYDVYSVFTAVFQVVTAPPTMPVSAPGPAFSWQGSVAGVNTGNGNKLTTVPIVGWTMRGGMPVSCALYHNSEGPAYGAYAPYGNKWQPSYFTYLKSGDNGSQTLTWDNGLSYTYTYSNGVYTPTTYGILDTLTVINGQLTLTTPSQVKYTFGFVPGNGYAYLSAITDLDGNTLTINHNSSGTINTVVDPANRTVTYNYDGTGRLSSLSDPLGRVFNIFFNTAGDLYQVNTPSLNNIYYAAVQIGYDGNHDIISLKNTRGYTATFGYDGSSRLAWAKDALGSQTTFNYGASATTITDPNGHALTYTYSFSLLTSVMDALNYTESYSYGSNNILSSKKDKLGKTWYYNSHLSNGSNTSTSTDALGYLSSVTYDADNKPLSSTDAIGNTTQNTYTADGHDDLLTAKVTSVSGASPSFTATTQAGGYANGLPTTFLDALNYSSSVIYDGNGYGTGWGYVTSATDANNHTTSATYNALGWKLTSVDGRTIPRLRLCMTRMETSCGSAMPMRRR